MRRASDIMLPRHTHTLAKGYMICYQITEFLQPYSKNAIASFFEKVAKQARMKRTRLLNPMTECSLEHAARAASRLDLEQALRRG